MDPFCSNLAKLMSLPDFIIHDNRLQASSLLLNKVYQIHSGRSLLAILNEALELEKLHYLDEYQISNSQG